MTYAIIKRAYKGRRLGISTLALVDRAKSKKLWWTSDNPHIILDYKSKDAALFAAGRLRFGEVKVVHFSDAVALILDQIKSIDKERDYSSAFDGSWDEHCF